MCMPTSLYGHHMPAGTCRGQKRASDPLEVELKAVVSCLVGELGTKPVPPGRNTSALKHRPITPAPSSESLQLRDFLGENKSPVPQWACSLNESGFLAFLLAILETPAVILAWVFYRPLKSHTLLFHLPLSRRAIVWNLMSL